MSAIAESKIKTAKDFKIHPSSAGKIMAGQIGLSETQRNTLFELSTRKKGHADGDKAFKPLTAIMENTLQNLLDIEANPQLPAGAKTYCESWMMEQIYKRKKTFTSKYTERGQYSEAEAIEVIRDMFGYNELEKNMETFYNEWIEGTPDAIPEDTVIENKCPWDCFTFPLFDAVCPEKDYEWQSQCYMDLTGKQMCKVVYILVDTPENLIIQEAKKWCFANGEQFRPEVVEEMRARLTYANIDEKYKRKVFEIERDNIAIAQIHERVMMCRKYITTFEGFQD